jgi:hypothetical protein
VGQFSVQINKVVYTGEQPGGIAGLKNFSIGGPWDYQRVGPDRIFVSRFTDFANVSIGLYAAGNGLPEAILLNIADEYAKRNSNFPNGDRDEVYTHLRKENVYDMKLGYKLYYSGGISNPYRAPTQSSGN